MTTLSISQCIGNHNACTYHGYLNFDNSESDWINDEVNGNYIPEIDYSDFDVENYEKWLDDLPEVINEYLRPILEPVLDKYGYKILSFKFHQPKEYNFGGDEIDIKISHNGLNIKPQLLNELELYLANVRKKSCDGYMSQEPDTIEDIDIDDYAMLWAIFKKEDIIDDIHEAINDEIIPSTCRNYQELFRESLQKFARVKDPEFFERKAQEENNQVLPL